MEYDTFPDSQEPQEQEIHLRDYLQIVIKRKATILTFFALTFLTVFIATYTKTPYYTSSSQVLIERNFGSNAISKMTGYARWDPDFLTTQFEIIKSPNVAHNVVKALQLDTKYRHYFFETKEDGLFTYLSTIKSGLKKFLVGLFSSDENENGSSPEVAHSSIASEGQTDADVIASIIRGNLSIRPVANTKTVYIAYSDKHPAMAKLITSAVVQAYIDETLEIKHANSNYSLQWMTSKANDERGRLEGTEIALQKYMRDNDLVTVEDKLAIYPQRLAEFSSQLSKAQAQMKEHEALYAQIQNLGTNYANIEMIPLFAESTVLQGLREKLFSAEQKTKDLSKKFGYKHPTMINAKAERELLLKEKKFEVNRIIESTRNSYELAKSQEQNLTQLLAKTKKEMLDVNERFTQYAIMKRDVDMSRVLYDALTSSIKQASVTEQSQDINIWVVKKAELPGAPSKPQKKRSLMMGLLLGLGGGIGLAFFIEYLDNNVKDGKDIEQRFGLTILGSVEEFDEKDDTADKWLPNNLLSPMAESYRLIQSNLMLSTPDNPPRTILISSMSPKEGKTTTTSNLAHILAQNGKKVLLIDSDMRRPRLHGIFSIPNTSGLSNFLAGGKVKDMVKTVKEDAIYLITAGTIPPNPSELLNSERMKLLTKEMARRYDFVLLDSPPIQRVTDSLTLSKLVDGTLIVVSSGNTTYEMLESGLKKLNRIHSNMLGIIVNRIKHQKNNSGYYGYYTYYQKDE